MSSNLFWILKQNSQDFLFINPEFPDISGFINKKIMGILFQHPNGFDDEAFLYCSNKIAKGEYKFCILLL